MTFEIGPISPTPGQPYRAPRVAPATPGFQATLAAAPVPGAGSSGVPAAPPAAVLDAVGMAASRAEAMAAGRRELHFQPDEKSGRIVIQVRDLDSGEVIRTIPPSEALDVMSGGAF
jgi:hypothetical protein